MNPTQVIQVFFLIIVVTPEVIELDDGSQIPYGMVVWSTGVAPRYREQQQYPVLCNCIFYSKQWKNNLYN